MKLSTHLGVVGPYGVIPDRRTTENSNVSLIELPSGEYKPVDPKKNLEVVKPTTKLATMSTQMIQDYPIIVRDQRIDPQWHKIKYWGVR